MCDSGAVSIHLNATAAAAAAAAASPEVYYFMFFRLISYIY